MSDFDDDLDFKKISKEVSVALAKDEKYQRENDAKFRAIHQKVKSYDEFRDIVEASHLRPLDKGDKLGGMSYQKWNQHANNAVHSWENESKSEKTLSTLHKQPVNSHEFAKFWKRSCPTPRSKFDYLVSINSENLKKCLDNDCMLGDIISTLSACDDLIPTHLSSVFGVLKIIPSSKRFSLALEFLSNKEVSQLQQLFQYLTTLSAEQDDIFQSLIKILSKQFKI